MAKRQSALKRKQKSRGGGLLTAAVVLLAVAACVFISPPTPQEVTAVFARATPAPAATVAAVTLPAHEWYIVDADGQAVAACGKLLEAEILREAKGKLASIRVLSTQEVALRITASPAQLDALRNGADAIERTFENLTRMAHATPADAQNAAKAAQTDLDALLKTLDTVLRGTENPVVRGLQGLVGSCREAMADLSTDAASERVQKKNASLALQYESYVRYLSGGQGSTEAQAVEMGAGE